METTTPDMTNPVAPQPSLDRAKIEQAKRRLAAIKGFYIHLAVFSLVLAGLLIVNLATGGEWWVHWVALGWGIGVVAHAIAVLGRASRAVAEWERRKLQQLMQER